MNTDVLVLGFYTVSRLNYLTTFQKPLWVPSSLVISPEHKCTVDWDGTLYRGGVVVDGVCGGQQGSGEGCSESQWDLLEAG
jgi:hypothetical protein